MTETSTGGLWSSSDTTIVSVDTTGAATGLAGGSAIISYSVTNGCGVTSDTTLIVVNWQPNNGSLTGNPNICSGATSTLIDTAYYGTASWTSSTTSVATVGTDGLVTGVAAGTSTIYFTVTNGCGMAADSMVVTVNPLPAAITGTASVCAGLTTSLADVTSGGTWSSTNTAKASVGSATGIVTGVAAGSSNIIYTLPTGCSASVALTVNPLAPVTGATSVCAGSAITLSNANSGGAWSSSNTGIATVVAGTGVVTGISAGTATVSYLLGTGCLATTTITVNSLPAAITGASNVCVSSTTTLNDATGGGAWSSSNNAVATIGAGTGVVSGLASGAVTMTYTLGTGCYSIAPITVNPLPAAITGSNNVCIGLTTTLTDGTAGGTWSSSNTAQATIGSASGTVTGVAAGSPNIIYTLATGCSVSTAFTVNSLPAAITGTTTVCVSSTTTLNDATGSGAWSSSNTAIATIGAGTGVVTGIAAGAATMTYTLGTGCYMTSAITVNPVPAAITGTTNVCVGLTTTLSDGTAGGTWSSSNTAQATVGSGSGTVTGVAAGTPNIIYTLATGCAVSAAVTINPLPAAITGASTVCVSSTTTLNDATGGGAWSSSNTAKATIGAGTGVVTGIAAGAATMTYTLGTGCFITSAITVNPIPAVITGTTNVCMGLTTTLSDLTAGGTWSSSNSAQATVGSASGIVTGVAAGTPNIIYTLATGCSNQTAVTVNPLAPISGANNVCVASTITLSNINAGGAWSSSNTAKATVGAGTGIVTGVAAGSATISYLLGTGCLATAAVTVNPIPAVITGTTSICSGLNSTLSDVTAGGTWSSSNTALATVGSASGIVTAIAPGTPNILYTLATGCNASTVFTVKPTPTASISLASGSICSVANFNTTAGVTGGYTISGYSWSPAAGLSSTTTANVTATASPVTETYTVTVSATDGCNNTAVTATVGSPTLTVTPALTYTCVGTGTVLTVAGSAGTTFAWSPATYLSGTSGTPVTCTPTAVGSNTYTVTSTITANGCTNTANVTVNAGLATFPWTEGFEGLGANTIPCNEALGPVLATGYGQEGSGTAAQVFASSGSGSSVGYSSGPVTIPTHSGSGMAGFGFFANNDYYFTPAFTLVAGNTYIFSFYYETDGEGNSPPSGGDYNAKMVYNTTKSLIGATNFQTFTTAVAPGTNSALTQGNLININNTTYQKWTGYFTPVTGGNYFFGINAQNNNLYSTVYWGFDDVAFAQAPTCVAPTAATSVTCTPTSGTRTLINVTAPTADSFLTIAMLSGAGAPTAGPVAGTNYATGASLGGGTIITKGVQGTSTVALMSSLTLGSTYNLYTYVYAHDSCNGIAYSGVSASVPSFYICTSPAPSAPVISALTPGAAGTATIALSGLPTDAGGSVKVYAWQDVNTMIPSSPASYTVPYLSSTYTVTGAPVASGTNLYFTTGETLAGCESTSGVSAIASVPFALPWVENFETSSSANQLNPNFMSGNAGYYTNQAATRYGGEDASGTFITAHGGTWDYLFLGGANSGTGYPGTGAPYIPLAVYPNQWLVTPGLYAATPGTYNLGFWYYNSGTAFNSISVQYSNNGSLPANSSSTMPGVIGAVTITPTTGAWTHYTTSVTISSAPQIIYLGLDVQANSSSSALAIDDIEICQTPSVTVTNSSATADVCHTGTIGLSSTTVPIASLTSGTFNYTWSGPGTITSTGSNATVSGLGALGANPVYTVTAINTADVQNLCTSTYATTTATITPVPTAIGGTAAVCGGSVGTYTISVSGSPYDNWSVLPTTYASGLVSGGTYSVTTTNPATAQTYTVTYSNGCGSSTKTTSLNVKPVAITGGASAICISTVSSAFTDATGGGVWSVSPATYGTINAGTGVFTATATPGTENIIYTESIGGCTATTPITVSNSYPTAIAGGTNPLCAGASSVAFTSTPAGGTWASNNTALATIGSSSGIATGVAGGNTVITYALATGCTVTKALTVNPLPVVSSITGATSVCVGSGTTLNDVTPSGIWSSSNTAIATVGTSGVVTGVSAGAVTISYSVTNSCGLTYQTYSFTVNPIPSAGSITGTTNVCVSSTTALSDATGGGVWSSSNTALATVGTTGIVTGVAAGNPTISYSVTNSCGTANATAVVTVNPLPNAGSITGTTNVCVSSTTALSDATGGGVWSSSNTALATVGTTGIVTGVAAGNPTISYSVTNGCGTANATAVVTVNPLPNAGSITGTTNVCVSSTTALSDATGGGVWSSSNTALATVGTTGIVTGVAAGNPTISYTVTNACGTANATAVVTVNPLPNAGSITGTTNVCVSSTTALSDATGGGVWSSSNTALATVGTTGIVTGVAAGNPTISYSVTNACGTANATAVVTVNPLPNAGSITGTTNVCVSSTTALSDATGGGVWSSSNTALATVGTTGIVTGVAAGNPTISYSVTNSCGTANTTAVVTVNPLPNAGSITGTTNVCVSSTTALSDATGGGVWSSSNTALATVGTTGIVTGVAAGNPTISYSVTNSCGTANATAVVTVNPLPNAGSITGTTNVCVSSTTALSDATGGGVWSSSNTALATVGTTGIVTGVAAGNPTISYTVTNACGTANATAVVTVNPLPNAGSITGTTNVCVSSTTALSDATSGGVWSSSDNTLATVGTTGIVTGVAAGNPTISYSVTNSCGTANATAVVTVNPLPNAGSITGTSTVCVSSTTALSDATSGGVWSSSDNTLATVGTTGIVTGVAAGNPTISYTVTNSCGTANATAVVTVNPLPNAGSITGTTNVCVSSTTALSDATGGGVWSSSNTALATVGTTGIVTGVAAGNPTISYSVTNSCGTANATSVVTVNPLPNAGSITGTTNVCVSSTTALSDATGGGVWSSSDNTLATVGTTGIVTGVAAGNPTISYSVTNSCGTANATAVVTVNPLPNAGSITGTTNVCVSSTTALSDATGGGVWSSSDNTLATVGTTGIVTGVAAGNPTISYSVTNSCGTANATAVVTVNPLPNAGSITGTNNVCVSSTTALSDAMGGGVWSSSNTALATVGTTGIVTGVAAGNPTISYSVTNSCGTANATSVVTVNPLPNAGSITGTTTVCVSSTTALSDASGGGVWSSSDNTLATVGTTGIVTGVSSGSATVSYSVTNSCGLTYATIQISINPLPNAGSITGTTTVCVNSTTTLNDATGSGIWSSSDNTLATVGTTGIVTGVAAGNPTISYSVTNSCGTANATAVVTVNPLPNAGSITGTTNVCVGSTTALSDASGGGVWSSNSTALATVGTTGIVTGVATGNPNISYSVTNSCGTAVATTVITVNSILPAGGIITTVAGNGTSGYSGDGSAATAAQMNLTPSVAVDCNNNMYIVDKNNVIRKVNQAGVISTFAGNGGYGSAGDGGQATNANFNDIEGIALDASGNVYISDAANHRIRVVNTSGIISTYAGNGTMGNGGNGGQATAAQIGQPYKITLDAAGNLYIADAFYDQVRMVNTSGIITCVAGTGTYGITGDGGQATAAEIGSPWGVAVDNSGNLYIADKYFNNIRKVNTSGIISLFAGNYTQGYSGDGGQASAAQLNYPEGVGVDGAGNVYIADGHNDIVRKVNASGIISTFAGIVSDSGYAGDGGQATAAMLHEPSSVVADCAGNVYISDYANSSIRKVTMFPYVGGVTTVCPGSTTNLNCSIAGGTWSSSNTATGTINTSGVVTGIAPGTTIITYTISNSCGSVYATAALTVNPLPSAGSVTGTTTVCVSSTTTLNDASTGGVWSSSDNTLATIGSTGIVTGVAAGYPTISYTVNNSCGTAVATAAVTVNPLPNAGSVTGTTTVCVSSATALSDATGSGVWSSSNTALATVGTSGIVTGVSAGTATISYSVTNSCGTANATSAITVNPLPNAGSITGPVSVCPSSVIYLNNIVSGGTWSSSNTAIATVGTSGMVTGVNPGSDTIYYAVSNSCGTATVSATVTVNPLPNAGTISGYTTVCAGSTTVLSETVSGGTWTSSNTALATVSPSGVVTAVVTGVASGTATISYSVANSCSLTYATIPVNVAPMPVPISGTTNVCIGLTTTLNDLVSSGTWSSSNSGVAAIDPVTGIVTGMSTGTAVITYMLPGGCTVSATVSTNPAPASITVTGGGTFCNSTLISASGGGGATIYFQGTTPNGTSTSNAATTQTIVSSGTYYFRALSASGCWGAQDSVIVNIPAITGAQGICVGASTTLSCAAGPGTWSSFNPMIASIGSASGVVTGMSAGTTTIFYNMTSGCIVTTTIATISSLPAISGPSNACLGIPMTLSDAVGGGTWTSTNTATATIGSLSGIVNAVAAGTTIITYSVGAGCQNTTTITVSSIASITGITSICVGSTTVLNDSTSGGTWTSGNTAVANIECGVGFFTGLSAGTAIISYGFTSGCIATTTMTVLPVPSAISGNNALCIGVPVNLGNTVAGGTWSSSNPAVATIGSANGVVTGLALGYTCIKYILGTGCMANINVTVNPISPITGNTNICLGLTTSLGESTVGGTWTSSNTAIASVTTGTNIITGVATGSATISYLTAPGCLALTQVNVTSLPGTVTVSGGGTFCGSTTITASGAGGSTIYFQGTNATGTSMATPSTSQLVTASGTYYFRGLSATGCWGPAGSATVNIPAIMGPRTVCIGNTSTLSSTSGSGNWTSSNTSIATIGSSTGIVTAVNSGTSLITFTPGSGCTVVTTVTINTAPSPITGPAGVALGQSVNLTSNDCGGTWSSSTPTIATVNSGNGCVTGMAAGYGLATITYYLGGSCRTYKSMTVNPYYQISGPAAVCQGQNITLTNAASGGTWSSNATSIATISGAGVVTGVSSGTALISYVLPTGVTSTATVTVNTQTPILGSASVCLGQSTTLSNVVSGGSWLSSAPTIATVNISTGVVTGIAAGYGSATISYTNSSGCMSTMTMNVNGIGIIDVTGSGSVCQGQTMTLTDPFTGGVWSSNATGVATVGSATGIVTGTGAGLAVISYIMPSGCFSTTTVLTNPLTSITGPTSVCVGQTINLNDVGGGSWSSVSPTIAAVGSGTGVVTGVASGSGTAVIHYTLCTGCTASTTITVNSLAPITVTGSLNSVCVGQTVTLTDPVSGGTWSDLPTGIATIGSATGILTGIATGATLVSYIMPTGCMATTPVIVNVLSPISGSTSVCYGGTATLYEAIPGGSWISSAPTIVGVGSATGIVTGNASGTGNAIITYELPSGCKTTTTLSVIPVPAIGGTGSLCALQTTTLTNTSTGGTWSATGAVASVNPVSGIVTGLSGGTETITYTTASSCLAYTQVLVYPLAAISGPSSVCAGQTITLTDAVSPGQWYSSATANATINMTTGVLTGITGSSTTTITYKVTSSGCKTTFPVTINPTPSAGTISGPASVSISGSPITLTDGTSGGLWTSSNSGLATVGSASGIVTGISTGAVTVSYTVTNASGCSSTVSHAITVGPAPHGSSTTSGGTFNMCVGSSLSLANGTPGGVWSSSDKQVALVDAETGIVTGIAQGRAAITYNTIEDTTGTSTVITSVIVTPVANAVVITANPGTTIAAGQQVSFTASVANGGNAPVYQWSVNGIPAEGATTAVFTTSSLSDNDSVSCQVTGNTSCEYTLQNTVVIKMNSVAVNNVTSELSEVRIVPNPNKGIFSIKGSTGSASDEVVIVEITDMLGQVVYNAKFTARSGKIEERIELSNSLSNGMYNLSVRTEKATEVFHMVVEQ